MSITFYIGYKGEQENHLVFRDEEPTVNFSNMSALEIIDMVKHAEVEPSYEEEYFGRYDREKFVELEDALSRYKLIAGDTILGRRFELLRDLVRVAITKPDCVTIYWA